MNYFYSNMAYLRSIKHLSQKTLGERIGCGQAAIANYESGRREPDLWTAVKIAVNLGTTIEEMVFRDMRNTPVMFGKNLKYLRKHGGYDQKDIGNLLGIKTPTISKYEAGTVQPSLEGLRNLSEFFGVTVDDLLKKDLETAPKKYAEVRLELLSQEERDLLNQEQSSAEKERYESMNEMQDSEKLKR